MIDTAPIFRGASGGKSDDKFVGIVDSFQNSSGLEIRTNPRGITLSNKLTKDSSTTVTEPIVGFLKASTGDIFAWGSSGGVYHKTGGTWYKNSNTITNGVLSAIEFDGYVYFTSTTVLYRVAVGSLGHSMTFSSFQTFTNTATVRPMSIHGGGNILLIGDKFQIASVDSAGVWAADALVLSSELIINKIQTFGSSVKIYSQYSGNATELSLWDGVSDSVQETITLNGVKVEQLVTKDGFDYIISNGQLGLLDGYKTTKLKEISGYSTSINSITVKGTLILYGGTGGLWAWGSLNKNYPEVLDFKYPTSNATTDVVGAVFFDGTDLYAGWSNGSTYGIDKLSTSYNSTGYLGTRIYYGDTRVMQKASNEVMCAFNAISGSDSIVIAYKEDFAANYTTLRTITAGSTKTNTYSDKFQLSGQWNYIEFRITLNSASGTTTPEFFELYLNYSKVKF